MDDQSLEKMLERVAQVYYKAPGSVTSALKTIAENLNKNLLDRNLHTTSTGRQGIGLLTLAVLREQRLTLAFCGPTHAYLVQDDQTQHIYDPQISGRGLGLTRSISIRFYQRLETQRYSRNVPQPTWLVDRSFPAKHPRAGNRYPASPSAGSGRTGLKRLCRLRPNRTGKLRLIRSQPAVQMVQPAGEGVVGVDKKKVEPAAKAASTLTPPTLQVEKGEQPGPTHPVVQNDELDFLMPFDIPQKTGGAGHPIPAAFSTGSQEIDPGLKEGETASTAEISTPPAPKGETGIPTPAVHPEDKSFHPVVVEDPSFTSAAHEKAPKLKKPGVLRGVLPPIHSQLRKFSSYISAQFGILGSYIQAAFRWLARLLLNLLKRLLPDESIFSIPAGTMAFTAIAVAVVIATAGAVMYFQKGRAAQYQTFYEQAVASSETARGQFDPIELRTAWDTTIFYINKAETYKLTSEASALRQTAQQALDELDYIQRLSFKSTFVGGLGNTADVTRLAATHNELFMFNSNGSNILRASLTGNGYIIDSSFNCSPSPTISEIVDIAVLPQGNPLKASIMAMDVHGNLMLCAHGEAPKMTSLAPPNSGWESPTALVLDQNHLYVLDPPKNAVWIYWNMDFTSPPNLFFDEHVPQMDDVVDLAVNRDDLYLLHGDGRTTTCKYSRLRESPTRCDDPASYSDPRPGRQSGVNILDAHFQQILYSPSPDSSLYMLDPNNLAVYHFSLRLNLQRQFRSGNRLAGDTATAFAVSPNRTLFLATGNQVYYTQMP
jgi:hypothetical protein